MRTTGREPRILEIIVDFQQRVFIRDLTNGMLFTQAQKQELYERNGCTNAREFFKSKKFIFKSLDYGFRVLYDDYY